MPDAIKEMLDEEERELEAQEAEENEDRDFEEEFTGEPVKTPEKESVQEAEKSAEEEQEQEVDQEHQKPSYEAMEKRLSRTEGVIGELQSRIQKMHRAGSQEAKKQKAKMPTREDIEKYVNDFYGEQKESIKENMRAIVKEELMEEHRERERKKLDKAYPSWEDDMRSDRFLTWLRVQKPDVIALYESEDSSEVGELLNLFYGKTPKTSGVNNSRLQSNIPATNRSSVTRAPQRTEDDDIEEGFRLGH